MRKQHSSSTTAVDAVEVVEAAVAIVTVAAVAAVLWLASEEAVTAVLCCRSIPRAYLTRTMEPERPWRWHYMADSRDGA